MSAGETTTLQAEKSPGKRPRLDCIDIVRGVVMCLMVLDHTRDFFGDCSIDALDLTHTNYPLFFARWITHFCAPTFLLLAGMSVPFAMARPQIKGNPWLLLALRGLWLAVLEQTFVHIFGWYFHADYRYVTVEVLWATGWSMVLLSLCLMLRLPAAWIALIGIIIEVFQPFLSSQFPESELWTILLRCQDWEYWLGWHIYVAYPVLQWFGVLAIGYSLGRWLQVLTSNSLSESSLALVNWKLVFSGLGGVLCLTFLVIRGINGFGDPTPWSVQDRPGFTALSFINLEKYPPSLDYLLMTLGPVLLIMPWLERLKMAAPFIAMPLITLGRVPLFFYVGHIFLVHFLAVVIAFCRYGHAEWLYQGPGVNWYEDLPGHPSDYGLNLYWVVFLWLTVIALLYPLCLRFDSYKRSHSAWWLSFI